MSDNAHEVNTCNHNSAPTVYTNLNMASDTSSNSQKLDALLAAVTELKTSQDGMKQMFENKLDQMRGELIQTIDSKITGLRDELSAAVGNESSRIDNILTTIQSMQSRIDTMEQTPAGPPTTDPINDQRPDGPRRSHVDDTDVSVMASGIPYQDGEDILQKAKDIISALGGNVSTHVAVIAATRFRARFDNRPPLVKITFHSVQEKITVLRNKMELKKSQEYNQVYLKSCKSHAERLIEINARTLIRQLPHGLNLRVDANGRIIQRAQQETMLT